MLSRRQEQRKTFEIGEVPRQIDLTGVHGVCRMKIILLPSSLQRLEARS